MKSISPFNQTSHCFALLSPCLTACHTSQCPSATASSCVKSAVERESSDLGGSSLATSDFLVKKTPAIFGKILRAHSKDHDRVKPTHAHLHSAYSTSKSDGVQNPYC